MTRTSRGDPSKGPGGGGDPGEGGEPGVREGPSPGGEGGFNRVSLLGAIVYTMFRLRHMTNFHRQKDHIKMSKFTKFGYISLCRNQAVTC